MTYQAPHSEQPGRIPSGVTALKDPISRDASENRTSGSSSPTGITVAMTVIEWLLYAIIFVLPLDAYLTLPGQSSGIFLSELLVFETSVFLGALLLWGFLRKRALPFTFRWSDIAPLGMIVIIGLIATIGAGHRAVALRECAKYAFYLAIFLIARAASHRPNVRRNALFSILLGFACVCFIGLVENLPGIPDFAGIILNIQRVPSYLPNSANLRAASTFRFSDELESYLLLILPMCVVCASRFRHWEERLFCWTLALLGIWLLILTYTRTAYFIIPVVGVLMIVFLSERRFGRLALWIGGVIAFFAILVLFFSEISSRFLSTFSSSSGGIANRYVVWNWAINGVIHHPLFGLGPRNLQYLPGAPLADPFHHRVENNAENSYLNVLADIGVVGFGAFAATIIAAIRHILRALRGGGSPIDGIWNLGTFGGFVALLFDGFVHPTFSSGQVTGLLCALAGLIVIAPRSSIPDLVDSEVKKDDAIASISDIADSETVEIPAISRRVVFLVNGFKFGGASLHALHIAKGMQAAGIDVLIIVPPGSKTGARALAMALPVRSLSLGTDIGRWRGMLGSLAFMNPIARGRSRRVIAALEKEMPSIFVCPFPREQIITANMNLHAIWVVHAPFRYAAHHAFIQSSWLRAARSADAIVAISERLGSDLKRQGIPMNRLHVIANAVPISPMPAFTSRTPFLIGAASRLVKDKGIQYLLMAMPIILEQFSQAHLVIAGSGSYERTLQSLAKRLGIERHVTFAGYLEDLTPFLRSLHVFVHPTVDPGEVLPTVILEAAGVGIPVVASQLASIPDEVRDEQTGFLTPPGDADAIASFVCMLFGNPALAWTMGQAGHDLVATQFQIDRAVAGFLSLCRTVSTIEKRPGSIDQATTLSVAIIHQKTLMNNSAVVFICKLLTAAATALWTILAARTLLPAEYRRSYFSKQPGGSLHILE